VICYTIEEAKQELSRLKSLFSLTYPKIVCTSGGFDPLHEGHIQCIQETSKRGDICIVIVNDDAFLIKKKGYNFLPAQTRLSVVDAIKGVDITLLYYDGTQNVAGALRELRPNLFCKGGVYNTENFNEEEAKSCIEVGTTIVFGIGGSDKVANSSELVRRGFNNYVQYKYCPPSIWYDESCGVF
jgi:D-beta-D-heptose 7-phosphate kinase/D-beta-D-heptose 1-phosphate adenosyltransferase